MKSLIIASGLVLFLTGCGKMQLNNPPYSPQTTAEIDARIAVGDFEYIPVDGVDQREIYDKALGRIFLPVPVGEFISHAVKREFRQAGISIKEDNASCYLDGKINDVQMNSLGFSTDYVIDLNYNLYDNGRSVIFTSSYNNGFNTSKMVSFEVIKGNIDRLVSDNIISLLTDKAFLNEVGRKCQ